MEKIRLLYNICLFLLIVILLIATGTYCFFGLLIAKKVLGALLLLEAIFALYLFFFDKGN